MKEKIEKRIEELKEKREQAENARVKAINLLEQANADIIALTASIDELANILDTNVP